MSSEDEDEADDDLNSEYTESIDEEESKLRVQSLANAKVWTSGSGFIKFRVLMVNCNQASQTQWFSVSVEFRI